MPHASCSSIINDTDYFSKVGLSMLSDNAKYIAANQYKKMAGTSAVFVFSNRDKSSPVERDGLTWTPDELHLDLLASQYQDKPAMATVLALEGLEEYDPPNNGDIRRVNAMDESFIYHEPIRGWVQLSSGFCSA
jgi:hypothetical protein